MRFSAIPISWGTSVHEVCPPSLFWKRIKAVQIWLFIALADMPTKDLIVRAP